MESLNQRELKLINEKKEILQNRLSEIASNKVIYNNDGVTNLANQYRPEKMADHYSELYDNEWTDLYEELDDVIQSDRERAKFITDTVMKIHTHCRKELETKYKQFVAAYLLKDINNLHEGFLKSISPLTQDKCRNKFIQTARSDFYIHKVYKDLENKLQKEEDFPNALESSDAWRQFVQKCVWIFCLLHMQNRDVNIVSEPTDDHKASFFFRPFTQDGDKFSYLVWPALCYMFKGKVIVLKSGVAQYEKQDLQDTMATDNTKVNDSEVPSEQDGCGTLV